MTRFLCIVSPQHGHINPTLAVVQELVERGDTVIFYATEQFRPSIEATGAIFRGYTSIVTRRWAHMVYTSDDPRDNPFIRMGHETIEECNHVIPQIRDDAAGHDADYILYDTVPGKMLAELLHLPAIQLYTTYALNQQFNPMVAQLLSLATGPTAQAFLEVNQAFDDFRASYQLPPLPFSSLLDRVEPLNIVFIPRTLQPLQENFDHRFTFVGHSVRPRFSPPGFPLEKLGQHPLLYISLGTIFSTHHQLAFIRDCFRAFRGSDWLVIQSIGKEIERAQLEPIPENFLVYQHVPQLEVLQQTDVFITHGGMNSTLEALYYGIPLVVVPQMPEQEMTAQQLARRGLAIHLAKADLTADLLQKTVMQAHTDPTFRANAQAMQTIMRASGGYVEAANTIQRFVESKNSNT
ncbi:MAG TPA: macrolide family glycosyltransferase [Ktedonosporobacter sp.]|jgi:MGT family glycosyltransferase|nr:macrolide family glycosyltransferase [Ktedonosporobacter sp.]